MSHRMLPILTTLELGQYVEVRNVSNITIEIDGWQCATDEATPGWVALRLTEGKKGEGHLMNLPGGVQMSLRIPVVAKGYLFGTADLLHLTTEDGAAGPTLSVSRKEGDSSDLTALYELK